MQVIEIPGGLSNFNSTDRFSAVDWKGGVDRLEIKKTIRTYNKGLGIIIDVDLKNTSTDTMTDVYFMRTVDPDNNQSNFNNPTGIFETTNTILLQGDKDWVSAVSASQADNSQLTLSGYSSNSRVTHGLSEVRDPVAVYNGSDDLMQSGSKTADNAISLAFKFDEIQAGQTVSFTHSYLFARLLVPNVELDPNNSSGSIGGSFKQVYLLGNDGVAIADDDVTITDSESGILEGLKVKLTNPMLGDLISINESLPSNMEYDLDETNSDTEISIKGVATVDEYIALIKTIRFENQNLNATLEPRELVVQVVSDTFILSNSNVTNIYMTAPVLVDSPISNDNIVSQTEIKNTLKITGKAAPNADLAVVLTDSDNNVFNENLIVNPDGTWEVDVDSAQLSVFAESPISVSATATDQYSNSTTGEAQFTKNTGAQLIVTSPSDRALIASGSALIQGESDPNAVITVTTLNGKECTTVADANGKWSCTLTGLIKGQTYPISVVAKNELGNEITRLLEIETYNVDLHINSPLYEATTKDTTPIIAGTTEPNIDVTISTEFGKVCNTKSDAVGNWSCELAPMPTGGPYNISVVAKNSETGQEATAPWRLSIPDIALMVTKPSLNQIVDDQTPVIEGMTHPNLEVTVLTDSGSECRTQSDAEGKWRCELETLEMGGSYDFTVTAKNPDTQSEASLPWNVGVLDGILEVTSPEVGDEVTESPLILKGIANPNSYVTVDGPDGELCSTRADDEGNWTCAIDNLVSGDNQEFTITSVTPGGIKTKITRTFDLDINDGAVKTALDGGAGSFNSHILLLLMTLMLLRKKRH